MSMSYTKKEEIAAQKPNSYLAPPPPPYDEASTDDDVSSYATDDSLDRNYSGIPHDPATRDGLPLPIVIPQTTTVWKGVFSSPFMRAWVPELEAHGLQKQDFIASIDGLNECFVPHPVFTGLNMAGGVMSMVQGFQPVQLAGVGLQVASGAASGATSYLRTRQYVKKINESYFHPAGLHLHVFDTKKMTARVGYPQEKLQLPPLDYTTDLETTEGLDPKVSSQIAAREMIEKNDPRLRRIKALEGHVMPLDTNVPEPASPDNLLKKMSAARAAKLERKQVRKMEKKQFKVAEGKHKKERKQDKREAKIEELERRLEATELELEKRKSADGVGVSGLAELEKERGKLRRKIEKRGAKREKRALKAERKTPKAEKREEKLERKQSKTANKIRWLVIVKRRDGDDSDEDSFPEDDGVGPEEDEIRQVSSATKNLDIKA